MRLYGCSIKQHLLFLTVLCSVMLAFTSCEFLPGENQEMFGITSKEPVGTHDNIRARVELAGLTYEGILNKNSDLGSYPDFMVHDFRKKGSASALIITGPGGDVISTAVTCSFESSDCLKYLSDLMTAHGFDPAYVDYGIEESRANNNVEWHKWHESKYVKGFMEKNPRFIGLRVTNRAYSKE